MGGTIGWILAAWPFTFILVDWDAVQAAEPQGIVAWFDVVLKSGLTGAALKAATKWTFIVAGIISLTLGVFSLALPHTPPKKKEEGAAESLAWLEALRLLKHPFVLEFLGLKDVRRFVRPQLLLQLTGTFLSRRRRGRVGIAGN
jgi:hypothetical protein